MKRQLMWFVIGAIVGMIGISTLSASRAQRNVSEAGSGWTERDVYRAINLLEQIADNTKR